MIGGGGDDDRGGELGELAGARWSQGKGFGIHAGVMQSVVWKVVVRLVKYPEAVS